MSNKKCQTLTAYNFVSRRDRRRDRRDRRRDRRRDTDILTPDLNSW
jgi:hypothetical protein